MEIIKEIKTLFIKNKSQNYEECMNLIYEESFKKYGYSKEKIKAEIENYGYHIIIIIDKKVVGHARLYKHKKTGRISQVVVSNKFRNNNLGSILINELVKKAKEISLEKVELFARIDSIEFYKKLGFSIYGKKFISPKTNIELINMEKNIIYRENIRK